MRIGIIGCNGSGKSILIKILQGLSEPSEGDVEIPPNASFGYVPQTIKEFEDLSGGQRLNKVLTRALASHPNILVLDEPTNHLDVYNRHSLLRLLHKFQGTLIVASHDKELLRTCIDTLWHIDQGFIHEFHGNYDDYQQEMKIKRAALEQELGHLDRQKKEVHESLMREQKRAKNSRLHGKKRIEQRKWPTIVSGAKAKRAEETSGRKKIAIQHKKQNLLNQFSSLRIPEIITPRFSLNTSRINSSHRIISITNGACGYQKPILQEVFLSLESGGRLAIRGNNGSGKSTLMKGILGSPSVTRSGQWAVPKQEEIGYLDQHYVNLHENRSVLEIIQEVVPHWPLIDVRRHLNDFLFRKNEEVIAQVTTLSGGERARLSLAQIAARPPKLLLLDEITNNLDLETCHHLIQILLLYPGAMIVISHDEDFLREIGIQNFYTIS